MTETTADNLLERFDSGEDVMDYFDMDHAVMEHPDPNAQKNLTITLPLWLVDVLDDEAERRAVPRKSIINDWLVDRADAERARRAAS